MRKIMLSNFKKLLCVLTVALLLLPGIVSASYTITPSNAGSGASACFSHSFGYDTNSKLGQGITTLGAGTLANTAIISVARQGAVSDDTIFTLEGDSGGEPDGIPIATSVSVSPAISGNTQYDCVDETVTWDGNPSLSANTVYWIVSDAATFSHSIYYGDNGTNPASYAYGDFKYSTAGVWSAAQNFSQAMRITIDAASSTPTPEATSTDEFAQSHFDLFFGFIVFAWCMWFVIWFFRKS